MSSDGTEPHDSGVVISSETSAMFITAPAMRTHAMHVTLAQ